MTFKQRKTFKKRRHKHREVTAYLAAEKRILFAVAGKLLKTNIPLELKIGVSEAILKPLNARDEPRFRLAIERLYKQFPNAFEPELFEN